MIFRDPENAKTYLRQNPDLLKQYIDEVDGPFLKAYSHKIGKTKETLLQERIDELVTNDEQLDKFIKAIILKNAEP